MVALPRTYDPGPPRVGGRTARTALHAQPRLGASRRPGEAQLLTTGEQLDRALLAATEGADGVGWLVAHATSVPLLARDEEVTLARTLRAGTPVEAKAARGRFVMSNLRLVIRMARNQAGAAQRENGVELADLIQEGMVGLLRAVERYDPESGNRFSTYATWWIAQSIHRALADTGHAIRLPVYRYEQRRRLLRLRTQFMSAQGREPTFAELAAAYGVHPCWNGRRNNTKAASQTMTAEEVAELLAIQAPVASLEAPTLGGAQRDDEMTLAGLLADPVSADDFEEREQDEDARWLLDIARYALRVGRGEALEQRLAARNYDVFVTRALQPTVTLEVLGDRWGITRERVRQIEMRANELVRAALIECGMTAPQGVEHYPLSQEARRDRRRREQQQERVAVAAVKAEAR